MGGCGRRGETPIRVRLARILSSVGPLLNGPYVATLRARESSHCDDTSRATANRKKKETGWGAVTRPAREEGPAKYIR